MAAAKGGDGRILSGDDNKPPAPSGSSAARAQLKAFIERVERLEEEKKSIADDIRDVYAEAKGNGFDTKQMRKVVALRKMDTSQRQEEMAVLDLYLHALGMIPETGSGQELL